MTSFFAPFERSGRVTHAKKTKIIRNAIVFVKYQSQEVRNTVRSFVKIQLTVFEKYS